MRILFTNSHPDRSEAAIITALKQKGHDVHVACDPDAVRLDTLRSAKVPVTTVSFKRKVRLRAISAVRSLIKSHRPDLIHTFNKRSLTNVLLATTGSTIPIVGYRGIIGNICPWNPEARLIFFNKRVKKIICVCHAVEKSLNSIGIPASKTVTIHKGHDISWYHSASRSVFSEWNIPDDSFILGCAARMRSRKGIPVLLKAISQLNNKNIHLVLAGEITDPQIFPMIKKSSLNDRVHPIGFRHDVCGLMGACDTFVMPSLRREGLPRAVIEAMAQETPAIVTSVGGMPELVRHETDGLVVEPNNAAALAEAIDALAGNPDKVKGYGRTARQHIIDSFDINKTVEQTLDTYDSIK